MKFSVVLIPFCFAAAMVQAETFSNSVVCLDCNNSEALHLIAQGPKLKMSCENAQPDLQPGLETQLCYSQPDKRLVINATTGALYGFEVSHRYQGVPLAEMEVSYSNITVPDQLQRLARDALAYYRSIQLILKKIAGALSREVTASSDRALVANVSGASDCSLDGDAKALNEILDLSNESRLQNDANSYFSRNFEAPEIGFKKFEFTDEGFEVERADFRLLASWPALTNSSAVSRVYFDTGSQLKGPEPYYPAKVVYSIQWDGNGVRLTLNPYQTIIDGYKFSAISRNKLAKSIQLSQCVAEVFKNYYGKNMVVELPASGTGSACKVHLNDRDGKEIASFMIPC